jgi:hypothetical protein
MKIILFILISYLSITQIFVSEVVEFTPGSGQIHGQSEEYYPVNIFGPPSINGNAKTPETRPEEICSIALNGEIILSFSGNLITNGEGVDFVIFENAFEFGNGRIYAEPAIISVSADGAIWHEFPYDIESLDGLAGKTPSNTTNTLEYPECGGDGFDLSDLNADLNEIKYIKIKDITSEIIENPNHAFYDPTLSGFDLDAIMGINYEIINSVKNTYSSIDEMFYFDVMGKRFKNEPTSGIYLKVSKNGVEKLIK